MMKPGLARAVPMGFLGFLLGALVVFILRALQGLDPIWDPAIGLILATFTSAFAFVWGMGAYNPLVNQHPHEPPVDEETGLILVDAHAEDAHHHDEHAAEAEEGFSIFGWSLWQVSYWTIILVVILAAIAILPTGFFLQTSSDPMASANAVGAMSVTLGEREVEVTQLTLFVVLVMVVIGSLAAVGGVIALGFYVLNSKVRQVNESPDVPLGMEKAMLALPSGEAEAEAETAITAAAGPNPLLRNAFLALRWVITSVVLYLLFYYVLIGLVIPNPPWLLITLSLVNALLLTALILNTTLLLRLLGKFAAGLLALMRGLPAFLGQK